MVLLPLTYKVLLLADRPGPTLLQHCSTFVLQHPSASLRSRAVTMGIQRDGDTTPDAPSVFRYRAGITERSVVLDVVVLPGGGLATDVSALMAIEADCIIYSFDCTNSDGYAKICKLVEDETLFKNLPEALLPRQQVGDGDSALSDQFSQLAKKYNLTLAVVNDGALGPKLAKVLTKIARYLKSQHEQRVEAERPKDEDVHRIIKNGDLQQLQFCLFGDMDPAQSRPHAAIRIKDRRGLSPLHTAVELGHVAMVQLLLSSGCDINVTDRELRTALHIAAAQGFQEIAGLLIAGGINSQLRERSQLTYAAVAAREGNLSFMDVAINEWGADPGEIKELDLTGRQLKDLPDFAWRKLSNLRVLDLSGNNLDVLPAELASLPFLEKVSLEGNPLRSIPDRFREPWPVLADYLTTIGSKAARWTEKKVLFVGQEGVGKTTLLKTLRSRRHKVSCKQNLSTDGIAVHQNIALDSDKAAGLSTASFSAWDFGGQEVFYPSHQFFLTSNSIFLVVFNLVDDDLSRVDYWMKQIALMNNSKHSPVLLVGTHQDDKRCTPEFVEEKLKSMTKRYPDYRYLGLRSLLAVSCKTGQGIKKLIDTLYHIIECGVHYLVPQSWIYFHHFLSNSSKKINYVRWSIYAGWARRFGVSMGDIKQCSNFLSDVGSLIYFDDAAGGLDDLVILNPQFLADLMATLITFRHSWVKQGKLAFSDLPQVLHKFDPNLVDSLLALLVRFRIIHSVKGATDYMVPSLLPATPPRSELKQVWEAEVGSSLREFRRMYQFSFLPLGFFSRLMLRVLHIPCMQGLLYWLEGFILEYEGQKARVLYDSRSYRLTISVRVSPDAAFPGLLLRVLMEAVESLIHGFYPRLRDMVERLVPCTHCIQSFKSLREPFCFTYAECIKAMVFGMSYVFCQSIRSPSRCVQLRDLAPDIAFADIPLLSNADLVVEKQLGAGGFGVVYQGQYQGAPVAIKELKFLLGNDEERVQKFREFQQEAWIMSVMEHPQLVRMLGCAVNPLRMVLELVPGGDLFAYIHPKVPDGEGKRVMRTKEQHEVGWDVRLKIAFDIALGMRHLHHEMAPPIIHRDLRSPNIFLVSDRVDDPVCAKVADFGLATMVLPDVSGSLGTWQWLAPEVIDRLGETYDTSSDVYSFGIVLWELCTLQIPFLEYLADDEYASIAWNNAGKEIRQFEAELMKLAIIEKNLRPTIPPDLPFGLSAMITACLAHDPQERPTCKEVVERLCFASEGKLVAPPLVGAAQTMQGKAVLMQQQTLEEFEIPAECQDLVSHAGLVEFHYKLRCMAIIQNVVWLAASDVLIRYDHATFEKEFFRLPRDVGAPSLAIHAMVSIDGVLWCGCEDGSIILWDTVQKVEVARFAAHSPHVVKQMIVVSLPKSKMVWTSSPIERVVYVWETTPPYKKVAAIPTPEHSVGCFAQHQDFVWVGGGGNLHLYNISTFQERGVWPAHTSSVTCILSLGNRVWTGSAAGDLKVWEDNCGQELLLLKELNVHCAKVLALCKYQTQNIWSCGLDKSILIWDAKTFTPVQEISDAKDSALMIARDGRSIYCASDKALNMWEYPEVVGSSAVNEEEDSKPPTSPASAFLRMSSSGRPRRATRHEHLIGSTRDRTPK